MKKIKLYVTVAICIAMTVIAFPAQSVNVSQAGCCCKAESDYNGASDDNGGCGSTPVGENSCCTDNGGCGCYSLNPPAACIFGGAGVIGVKAMIALVLPQKYDFMTAKEIFRPPAIKLLS